MNTLRTGILTFFMISITGCASTGHNRDLKDQISEIFYAQITNVEKIKFESDVGKAAIAGSLIGVIEESDGNSEDMIAGGIAGALVWGLFSVIAEGSNTGYSYSLKVNDNRNIKIITSDNYLAVGDCVEITSAKKAHMKKSQFENCSLI